MVASKFPPEEFLSSLRGQIQGFLRDCYQAQGQSRQLLTANNWTAKAAPGLCLSPDIGHLCFTDGEVSHTASTGRILLRRGTFQLLEFCIIIILAAEDRKFQGYSSYSQQPVAPAQVYPLWIFEEPIFAFNIFIITVSLGNISHIIIWIPAELRTSVYDLLTVAD